MLFGDATGKWIFLAALCLMVATLGGCVSTTERVFTEEASPKEALQKRVALARRYIGEGDWERAKRNLELAKQIDPDDADVHEAFALMYQSSGELELAEEHFERAIRLDRDCSRCRNNYAAYLYSQERYREAEEQLERVVRDSLYSGRPRAFVNLGLCRRKLSDNQGADEAFVRALSLDSTNRIALLELTDLRLKAGDYRAAREYYSTYRSLVRRQSPRGLWLGIRLARQSGDTDAEASYALALGSCTRTRQSTGPISGPGTVSEAALRQFDAFSTPGSLLRAAREAQGMSEREAADRLNLMPDYVGFLERDEYQSLRSPPFARGYVKSYGRLLGLDEQQLLALFDEQWAGRRSPVSSGFTGRPAPLQRTGVGVVVSLVVLLLLVLALWWWRGATPESAAEGAGDFDRAAGTALSFAQAGE